MLYSRVLCRSRNPEAGGRWVHLAGYATAVSLGQALKAWIGIHSYTLSVLAHSMLRRSGGVDANLRLGRTVVFRLGVSSTHPESAATDQNRATAFFIHRAELQSKTFLSQEELEGMRLDVDSAARAGFFGDSANMAPTGFVYVMFFVQGTQFSLGVQCAVYRALNHPDDAPLSERVLAVCKDMNTLLMAFVNDGIVTQAPAHPAAPPEMGQMVRRRKTWRFAREEGRWRSVALETRLPAMSLWTYFRQW